MSETGEAFELLVVSVEEVGLDAVPASWTMGAEEDGSCIVCAVTEPRLI